MSDNLTVLRDMFSLACYDEIGRGAHRIVYVTPVLPGCVVKVEDGAQSFQNIVEWETWKNVEGTEFEKWFAPCMHISRNGCILVMKRTTRPTAYPDKLPAFLTDTKQTNYGMYKDQFVCHDYGLSLLMQTGLTKRQRKVKWWNVEDPVEPA
jgi:hypothetical protein